MIKYYAQNPIRNSTVSHMPDEWDPNSKNSPKIESINEVGYGYKGNLGYWWRVFETNDRLVWVLYRTLPDLFRKS